LLSGKLVKYKKALVWFRRDLRIEDNQAYAHAQKLSQTILPLFIFDPRQISDKNKYRGQHSLNFMYSCIDDLTAHLQLEHLSLLTLQGMPHEIIKNLIIEHAIDALFFNHDYTPFSYERDTTITNVCAELNIAVHTFHDTLLIGNPALLLTQQHTPYQRFTPFYTTAILKFIDTSLFWHERTHERIKKHDALPGKRYEARSILTHHAQFKNYIHDHDFPALDSTTHLAPYLKFGVISAREALHALQKNTALVRQLYWRDFFTYIAYHFPHVFTGSFHSRYDRITWHNNDTNFQRWATGTTGFPIVDAGMRQLVQTGFMHNRVRMITASFLIKDLHIDWHEGERFFAQHLTDYDPCLNNGNWQWVASSGCDAQQYTRIFNPWLQQQKFDPEAQYIKQFIPELNHIPNKDIHEWYKKYQLYTINYPRPMLDHTHERAQTLKYFKQALLN
jgi:deoxyribodipyrimidine photo-lyase